MVRDYELMYIIRPELDDEAVAAAVESVAGLVAAQDGEVTKSTMWGRRRLAYTVSHLREGHYVIASIRLEGSKVAPLERALRIHDNVFRHLLVVDEFGGAVKEVPPEGVVAVAAAPAVEFDAEEAAGKAEVEAFAEDEFEPAIAGSADEEN